MAFIYRIEPEALLYSLENFLFFKKKEEEERAISLISYIILKYFAQKEPTKN